MCGPYVIYLSNCAQQHSNEKVCTAWELQLCFSRQDRKAVWVISLSELNSEKRENMTHYSGLYLMNTPACSNP